MVVQAYILIQTEVGKAANVAGEIAPDQGRHPRRGRHRPLRRHRARRGRAPSTSSASSSSPRSRPSRASPARSPAPSSTCSRCARRPARARPGGARRRSSSPRSLAGLPRRSPAEPRRPVGHGGLRLRDAARQAARRGRGATPSRPLRPAQPATRAGWGQPTIVLSAAAYAAPSTLTPTSQTAHGRRRRLVPREADATATCSRPSGATVTVEVERAQRLLPRGRRAGRPVAPASAQIPLDPRRPALIGLPEVPAALASAAWCRSGGTVRTGPWRLRAAGGVAATTAGPAAVGWCPPRSGDRRAVATLAIVGAAVGQA